MKQFRLLFFFVFTFAFSATQAQTALPSVELKTLDGKTVNLKDYIKEGKITVISFWATWCAPCKKELAAISDLYPDWQEKYNAQLLAITIDTQRALAQVGPLVETEGWEYIVLSDANNQLKNALNFQAIPQTYLVDQQGNIVYSHSSYVPGDEFELEAKIKALAGKE
ncbi:MAG: TlpA family protein disulfide reductase [Saprospiraceae bacterium]|nr:TlpA family protein disulfide reductase [Saprospiraceae bacterium]